MKKSTQIALVALFATIFSVGLIRQLAEGNYGYAAVGLAVAAFVFWLWRTK